MAGNALIGALRVSLGIDSAQFSAGLKSAQKGLGSFGKAAAIGFAGVAAGAAAAAAALAPLVKGAIDHADALGKSAQKAGTTVEALSRLEYAAKLSDISLETLTGSLQKLSKTMADAVATPTSTAATAFKALGIELKNTDGTLRNSDQVLTDVADRFSRLEDGSTKTALAMQMFGKSGAELIPLLNSGRDGLKSMADESDRLGATISTKTAKAAEEFNDTLTRIQEIMQGVINRVIASDGVMSALQSLANMLASAEFIRAAEALALAVVSAMDKILFAVNAVSGAIDALNTKLAPIGGIATVLRGMPMTAGLMQGLDGLAALQTQQLAAKAPAEITVRGGAAAPSDPPSFGVPVFTNKAGADAAAKAAAKAMSDQIKSMNADLASQKEAWEELQQPIRDTVDAVAGGLSNALSGLVSDLIKGKDAVGGLINAFGQLGDRLIQMAMDQMIQGLLGSLFGAAFGGGAGLGVGKGLTGAATYGFTGNGVYGIPSFDGGGFTGRGSRGGGMDGKGGFLAMLHPDETVLDHSKGQGAGSMTFNITGSKQDATAIAEVARREAMGVFQQMQRNPDRR